MGMACVRENMAHSPTCNHMPCTPPHAIPCHVLPHMQSHAMYSPTCNPMPCTPPHAIPCHVLRHMQSHAMYSPTSCQKNAQVVGSGRTRTQPVRSISTGSRTTSVLPTFKEAPVAWSLGAHLHFFSAKPAAWDEV